MIEKCKINLKVLHKYGKKCGFHESDKTQNNFKTNCFYKFELRQTLVLNLLVSKKLNKF